MTVVTHIQVRCCALCAVRCPAAADPACLCHATADPASWPGTDINYAEILQPLAALTALALHGRKAGVVAQNPGHLTHMPLLRALELQHAKVQVGLMDQPTVGTQFWCNADWGEVSKVPLTKPVQ